MRDPCYKIYLMMGNAFKGITIRRLKRDKGIQMFLKIVSGDSM
jgi:hypothetical protein